MLSSFQKYFVLVLFFVTSKVFAVGEIAFTSFQASDPDQFSFVTLVDFPGNYELLFTDNGWFGDNSGFRTNEGVLRWTTPAGGVSAGTAVTIVVDPTLTVTTGTISTVGFTSFQLSTSGDQITAYFIQNGTGTIKAIAAINFGTSNWSSNATSANNSALPLGLTDGVNAISLSDINNGRFNCTGGVTTGSKSVVESVINNESNWTTSETILVPAIAPCNFTITGAALPVQFVSLLGGQSDSYIQLSWQTAAETNNEGFAIQKSSDAKSFENIGFVNGQNEQSNYTFVDDSPKAGHNYYRLEQRDFDGTKTLSKIISVLYLPDGEIQIFPNPAQAGEDLSISGLGENGNYEIYRMNGQKIPTQDASKLRLQNGEYIIKVFHPFGFESKKLIVR